MLQLIQTYVKLKNKENKKLPSNISVIYNSMRCQMCDKTSLKVGLTKKLRGHINPTVKQWRKPNLQWTTLDGKKIRVCVKCLKTIAKKGRL